MRTSIELTNKFFIQPTQPRPDFRLVITFLWSEFHNVDTEGDSYNPATRDWTWLYCQNREKSGEIFQVLPLSESPFRMEIESDTRELAARVAYFLATETQALVALDPAGPWHDPAWLIPKLGNFDLEAADERAQRSCWRESTLENPYPNRVRKAGN